MASEQKIKPARRFEGCPVSETSSGIPIKPVYGPQDINNIDYQRDLADPGEYPFTRGIWRDMYRGKLWTKRIFTGLGSPSDTNQRYKYLIEHGETGLYWQADTPTNHMIDPDHPLAKGNVGVCGISFCRLADIYDAFDGISLEEVSFSNNSPTMAAPVTYAALVAYAEDQGYDLKKLSGSFINEYLFSALTMYNMGHFPEELSVKLSTDVIEYSIKHTPRIHPLAPNPYNLVEFGANAIQEIAFSVAIAGEYIERMLDRGYGIDEFATRISVFGCTSDMDFFEQIAKFRATRRLWAKLMRERYGAKDPRSCRLYLSAHTCGSSLTRAQPVNNVIRIALQSLACVLGGLQSFDPCGYAEPYYLMTEEEALTCLNTHHILSYESRVAATADPLAGSYYVEWLTSKMEQEMWQVVNEIEQKGGALKAIGWMREQLEKGSMQKDKEIEGKKRVVVGLNDFIVPKEQEVPIKVSMYRPFEEQVVVSERREREIREFRQRRDNKRTKEALEQLWSEAQQGERHNLIPAMIAALRGDATMEEIIGVIRKANGYHYDPYKMVDYPF